MADSATTPEEPVVMGGDVIVEFNEASSRQQINSGESVKTLFGKLKKFLTDLKAVAFSGAYSDLSGAPDLTQYASKAKYGDSTINVGRKTGTDVGINSTAEGQNTTASMFCSHAEGNETTASGSCSHAEGFYAIARGVVSHAEGEHTVANGDFSHTRGFHTIANNDYETASGIYNISNSDTLFSVGDGTADDARHNAFEITTTGGKLHDKDIATTDMSLKANGGNADTVDGLHASNFIKNASDWTPMNFEITYGDHNYPKSSIDESIPVMPRECNYTHIVSRYKNGDSLASVLSIPADYDDDIFLYQAHTGVWKNIADGGNANTLDGFHAGDFYSPNNKPYVTGTLSEQASGTNVTMSFTIFNFTPSKVLCQFGSGNAFFANVVTNGFSVTIPAGTTTIHYIAFK